MPEKTESLEQAARKIIEIVQLHTDTSGSIDDAALTEQEVGKKLAERERQVWAEAAKITEEMAGDSRQFATQTRQEHGTRNYLYLDAVAEAEILELAADKFRARGEQAK